MTTAITQTVRFDAPVDRAYRAIADSTEHASFTGAPAVLPDEPGGAFTTHGGAIEGRMLELVPDQRLVQAWRPADWPAGVYSVVRYEFSATADGSQITLTHTGLPDEGADHLAQGWQERYWEPLAAYLSQPG
jgi:activator of HSP90 ATPase